MTFGVLGHRAIEAIEGSRTLRFQLDPSLEAGGLPIIVGDHGILFLASVLFWISTSSHLCQRVGHGNQIPSDVNTNMSKSL